MTYSPYPSTSSNKEIDLRRELYKTFFGEGNEIAKSYPALLRKMQRDEDDELVLCPCVDSITGEPDRDRWCPISHSEKYLWDEELIDLYKVEVQNVPSITLREDLLPTGTLNVPLTIFYVEYDIDITQDDKIVELRLDEEGDWVRPGERVAIHRINAVVPLRSDGGRIEFIKVACHKEGLDSRGIRL